MMMDWEYSLRITYLKAKIVYYTGCNSLSVTTPGNVTSTASQALLSYEGYIGQLKYNYKGDNADTSLYSRVKVITGLILARFRAKKRVELLSAVIMPGYDELKSTYITFYKTLAEYNHTITDAKFIY